MTAYEQRELLMCIMMRVCVVETGDPVLRATDVQQQIRAAAAAGNGPETARLARMLRPLNEYQLTLIRTLEGLHEKISKAKVTP